MGSNSCLAELDPLLEEEHAFWETIEDGLGSDLPPEIELQDLFSQHPDQVLRRLQKHGVTKLGEFTAKSTIIFPAFKGSYVCTLGSQHRFIDYERVWREELLSRAGPAAHKAGVWTADILVEAFVVNVEAASDPDKDGLLQPLLRRWQSGGCTLAVFGLPAVQATITHKWHTFARKLLFWELAFFLVWLAAFYGFTILFQDEDLSLDLKSLVATQRGAYTVALEILALVAMLPFLILEQGTFQAYGLAGWWGIWNFVDMVTYVIQITVSVCHLGRIGLNSNSLSTLLALQCIFLLFRLQYYSRVFKSTRFSFLDILRDVLKEIKSFFLFLIIIMFGFAFAFLILFRRDQAVTNFDTLPHAFLKIYSSQGGLDFEEMLESHVPVAAALLNVAYAFVMGMVLVNLLIGIMSNALNRVTEHEALKLLLYKAEIIDELEATLPRWLENRFKKQWYPQHIHVLRIDPNRVERVDLGALWAPKSGTGTDLGGGDGGKKGDDDNDEKVQVKLDACMAALETLTAEVRLLRAGQQAASGGMIHAAGAVFGTARTVVPTTVPTPVVAAVPGVVVPGTETQESEIEASGDGQEGAGSSAANVQTQTEEEEEMEDAIQVATYQRIQKKPHRWHLHRHPRR